MTLTLEQQEANALNNAKIWAQQQLIDYLNGATYNILSAYPQPEVQTWPYQKAESEALIAAGESASLTDAPILTIICAVQYGDADDETRLQQVLTKAQAVVVNATAWAFMAASINGIRARVQSEIAAATTPLEVNNIIANTINEIIQIGQ